MNLSAKQLTKKLQKVAPEWAATGLGNGVVNIIYIIYNFLQF